MGVAGTGPGAGELRRASAELTTPTPRRPLAPAIFRHIAGIQGAKMLDLGEWAGYNYHK